MCRPLIILTGPTAVGKTALSISLAKAVGGEIISADSMQVYRHMDIGSAKIRPEEMQGVPHYLIDEISPKERFDVVRFQQLALSYMDVIYKHGHIPILTGGTGFYIQSVLYGVEFTEHGEDEAYRRSMQELADKEGPAALHRRLMEVDPKAAEEIHENNIKRVIRALEFYHATGTPISVHNERERQKESPYRAAYFVLTDDREKIYERIDRRVDAMLEHGLLDEVRALQRMGCTKDMVSMQGLGYQELLQFLLGELPFEEAVRLIKRDSRHFAKRQLTWFQREKDVIWVDRRQFPDEDAMLLFMKEKMREKGILP